MAGRGLLPLYSSPIPPAPPVAVGQKRGTDNSLKWSIFVIITCCDISIKTTVEMSQYFESCILLF